MTPSPLTLRRSTYPWLLAAALALSPFAMAVAKPDQDSADLRILQLHNRERAAVGVPPLSWDPTLARAASSYGPELARLGRLVHSSRASRPGQRENLARIQSSHSSADVLVGSWIQEKRNFKAGVFPAVSRTGTWSDIAHYSQMIWKGTTHIGCAIYRHGGWDYLICRYSPPGNIDGKIVP